VLEVKVAQERKTCSLKAQMVALEKVKAEKQAHSAFEREWPGIVGCRIRSMSAI
jgi:hypothetical protein